MGELTMPTGLEIEDDRLEYEASPKLMPEYQEPGSGAYAAIYDPTGKLVVRSPSLGENPLLAESSLPVRSAWRRNVFVFEELEEGPDGIPCATVTLSFLVGVEVGEEEEVEVEGRKTAVISHLLMVKMIQHFFPVSF